MKRREFIVGLGAMLAELQGARAQQQSGTIYRVGYLGSGTAIIPLQQSFLQGLRELGWIEGQNLAIDYRFGEGRYDSLPDLANELIRLRVDVIVASPTPAALAAKNATKTVPIVGIGFDSPIENGLVASLSRPGGNFTGLSYGTGPEIFGKDLGLLREVFPNARRVAILSNSTGPNHAAMVSNVKIAAETLGVALMFQDVQQPRDFEAAFDAMTKDGIEAPFVFGDSMFGVHRAQLAELSLQHRLPSMHTNRPHVQAGGLMSYGPSFPDLWRRAAAYVDKIFRGAKPADLPVEQPTKFELVINLKTAKAFGITRPPTLLARADEVIE